MLNEFLFGMAIGTSLMPVWYILVEVIDKFYRAFVVNGWNELD